MTDHEIDKQIAKLIVPVTRAMTIRVKQIIQECAVVPSFEDGWKAGMTRAAEIAEAVIDGIEFDEHGDRGAAEKVVAAIHAESKTGLYCERCGGLVWYENCQECE